MYPGYQSALAQVLKNCYGDDMQESLIQPDFNVLPEPGFALKWAQDVFGAPYKYATCTEAWEHTEFKHSPFGQLPTVPALVWFSNPSFGPKHLGEVRDIGCVGVWTGNALVMPEDYFLAMRNPDKQLAVFAGVNSALEHFRDLSYVGWSEDLNGLRISKV